MWIEVGPLLDVRSFNSLVVVLAILLQAGMVASVVAPSTNCYAFDNTSHLFDFSSWIGHLFELDGKDSDLVIRFCKDVESRSQKGYVHFGRFGISNYFVTGSGHINFVQEYYGGDLLNCEQSFDKMGRSAQVNIICGDCLNGQCKGKLGCICNVRYEKNCRVLVELSIRCGKHGPRVFEGFTVGFHPRSWEVVYNGMTLPGFEKRHHEYSFGTEQTRVPLYMTAVAAVSNLVGKPVIKIIPDNGLQVRLSGSGATGSPPTTLSPTMLIVDWRCEKASDTPYTVDITIPVEGYDEIQFTLTKVCEYRQDRVGDTTRGWAIFGVLSCVFIILLTLLCCGGFIYKTRVEHQHGLDALPGMTTLSACLETVTRSGGYSQAADINSAFITRASWERQSVPGQGTQRTSETRYGSI